MASDPEASDLEASVSAAFDPEALVPLASALSAFVPSASSVPGLAEQVVQVPFSCMHLLQKYIKKRLRPPESVFSFFPPHNYKLLI